MKKPISVLLQFITMMLLATPVFAVDIQTWQLENGAKVFLVERHDIPILDVQIDFDAGTRRDDPNKIGVADFSNGLADSSVGQLSEEAFKEKITELAIGLGSFSSLESAGISLRTLSKPATLSEATKLANLILTEPRYEAAIIKREQDRAVQSLKQGETDPGFLAGRAFTKLNYPTHPYGFDARETENSIRKITREDLVNFHKKHFVTEGAIVSIVGDIDKNGANNLALALLKNLPKQAEPLPDLPQVIVKGGQSTNIAHPASQAHIVMGYPVFTRDDPDYYALLVGNYIFGGGGFDSRLMKELRDKRGFTYGAYSSLSPLQDKGVFQIGFSTKKESAAEALDVSKQVLTQFIKEGPTDAELKQAKDNIIGGFPLRFDSNRKLIGYLSVIGLYNLPLSFLDDYPAKVQALTKEDIKAAWQKRIKPEELNIVVVGGKTP